MTDISLKPLPASLLWAACSAQTLFSVAKHRGMRGLPCQRWLSILLQKKIICCLLCIRFDHKACLIACCFSQKVLRQYWHHHDHYLVIKYWEIDWMNCIKNILCKGIYISACWLDDISKNGETVSERQTRKVRRWNPVLLLFNFTLTL